MTIEGSVFVASNQEWKKVIGMEMDVEGQLQHVIEMWTVADGMWKRVWPPTILGVDGMEWLAWDFNAFDPLLGGWLETQVFT